MADKRIPTLRARWLGQRLRQARETARLTLREAGDYLQRDPSTVSRFEAGLVPVRVPDVLALLNLYGVDDRASRTALERLSRDVWTKGWWDRYAGVVADWFLDYPWLEAQSVEIRSFDPLVLPGLCQTEEYARHIIRAKDPQAPADQVNRFVEFRLRRQRVLDAEPPPRLLVILDEAVLCRTVGGPAVMGGQLRHLVSLAERPTVDLRVLPFRAGAHACHEGAFRLFTMSDPYPQVAYAETPGSSVYLESTGIERFHRAWELLAAASVGPEESAALIAAAMGRLDDAGDRSGRRLVTSDC